MCIHSEVLHLKYLRRVTSFSKTLQITQNDSKRLMALQRETNQVVSPVSNEVMQAKMS